MKYFDTEDLEINWYKAGGLCEKDFNNYIKQVFQNRKKAEPNDKELKTKKRALNNFNILFYIVLIAWGLLIIYKIY